jgi:DNA polymerase III delta prime subunit
MISLVVLQQSNILPNEQANIMLKKGIILQKNIPSANDNDSFADLEVVAEQIDLKEKASYSAISSQLDSPVVSPIARTVINITKMASAEKVVRAAQYEKQKVLTKQKSAERLIHLPPASMQLIEKIELNDSITGERPIPQLSIKQFQQYIFSNKTLGAKYQWLWSLHSENDMAFIIDIFQNNQQPLRYRLDKDTYQIIDDPTHDLKKLPFKNRSLSEIIILNTNK